MDVPSLIIGVAALIAALVAAYYTYRSFQLQRVSSSPAGLQFLVAPLNRERPIDWPATHVALGVYARGPGVRYNTSLAVWGDVDARNFSDSRTSWSADDEPLSCEVALEGHELNQPVYFGVVWESPSFWHRGFLGHGYRIQLTWDSDGKTVKAKHFEIWMGTPGKTEEGQWRLMPSSTEGRDHTTESTASAKRHSATLNDQLKRTTEGRKWKGLPLF
ncbi:hypothetical protein [uncultured Kocuria sp.]|uniref:hypothetical protein n=1 Tax=uncultured Kocuria sp. TaxID=259305 RepID=UPI002631C494|nr:hypothetical protein [uncultured Kocuria sp.]